MKQKNIVWQFTNKQKLTASDFIDYFERKVFRTIRKYDMLPKDKKIKLKKNMSLNVNVLKFVVAKKFKVVFSNSPNLSSMNMSDIAEDIFLNILKGKFGWEKPNKKISKPLYFLSDAETELYAKLKKIVGKRRKKNEKVRKLFARFEKKNPDLEHNIVNAVL